MTSVMEGILISYVYLHFKLQYGLISILFQGQISKQIWGCNVNMIPLRTTVYNIQDN